MSVRTHTYYMYESTRASNSNGENDVKWTQAWFCIYTMYMYDHCPIVILLRCSISVWTNSTPIDKCMSSICIYTQMIDVYVRFIQRARIRSRIIEFVWILSIVKNRCVVAWLIFNTSKRLKWVWDVHFPLSSSSSSSLFFSMYACLVWVICHTLNFFSHIYSINSWVGQDRSGSERKAFQGLQSTEKRCVSALLTNDFIRLSLILFFLFLCSACYHYPMKRCNNKKYEYALEHHRMNRVIEDVK